MMNLDTVHNMYRFIKDIRDEKKEEGRQGNGGLYLIILGIITVFIYNKRGK